MMKGYIVSYLASPSGREMIHSYLSSPEGLSSIREYLQTPRGRQTALAILPLVLEAVNLPDEVKNTIRDTQGKKN